MKEKVLFSFTLMFICVSMFSVLRVSADDISLSSEYQEAYNKAYQEYKSDEQFLAMIEDYGMEYGEEFLANVALNAVSANNLNLVRGGGGNICYQYVKNIMQTKYNNCGTTTVLQSLYGLNSASAVSGSTDANKISTLDQEYNVDSQGSLIVYQAVNALNKYNTLNPSYIYKVGTSMTLDQFEANVANSLTAMKPVILHARTEYFTYYKNRESGHYLSLDYINRTSKKVRIVDCNNNTAYYGIHTDIPLSEAYASINATSGRYLIY